jgi:hypothetical protein
LPNKDSELSVDEAAFRRDIGSRIHPHIEEFAQIIGLSHASPQFEHDVIEAVHWCIVGTALPRKRYSAIRKDLLEIGTAARAAEKSLGRLRTAYESLSAPYQNTLKQPLNLLAKLALGIATKQGPEFYALSSVARAAELYAAAFKGADKGGVRQNIPFRLFVLYLAVAFQNATHRKAKVTWDDVKRCYKGRFINFVERVLSLMKGWPERLDGKFSYPSSPRSRGKYIYDLTRAGAGKRKTAR